MTNTKLNNIFTKLKQVSDKSPDRTVQDVFLKLSEEVGELAVEVNALSGRVYKSGDTDGIVGEVADIMICCLDLLYKSKTSLSESIDFLLGKMNEKIDKWESKIIKRVHPKTDYEKVEILVDGFVEHFVFNSKFSNSHPNNLIVKLGYKTGNLIEFINPLDSSTISDQYKTEIQYPLEKQIDQLDLPHDFIFMKSYCYNEDYNTEAYTLSSRDKSIYDMIDSISEINKTNILVSVESLRNITINTYSKKKSELVRLASIDPSESVIYLTNLVEFGIPYDEKSKFNELVKFMFELNFSTDLPIKMYVPRKFNNEY